MTEQLSYSFNSFRQSGDGQIFTDLPIGQIRQNPDQPPLHYLTKYLQTNSEFDPDYFTKEKNLKTEQLQPLQQKLDEIITQAARKNATQLKPIINNASLQQRTAIDLVKKTERLSTVLEANKTQISRFYERQEQIEQARNQIQLKKQVQTVLQVFNQIATAPKTIQQLLYLGDIVSACIVQACSEVYYFKKLGIVSPGVEQGLLDSRRKIEPILKQEILKCIYPLEFQLPNYVKMKGQIEKFMIIKTDIYKYHAYLNDLRLFIQCKQKTIGIYYDYKQHFVDINETFENIYYETAEDKNKLSNLCITNSSSLHDGHDIGIQEYLLILGQSLNLIEYGSRYVPNNAFTLFDEIIQLLNDHVYSFYGQVSKYYIKWNKCLESRLYDPGNTKPTTDATKGTIQQEARRHLLNPKNGSMEEYHMMLYLLYQSVKNLYILDLSIHILCSEQQQQVIDMIKTFMLLTDQKFVGNVEMHLNYDPTHAQQNGHKLIQLTEVVQKLGDMFIEYFLYLNEQDQLTFGIPSTFFKKIESNNDDLFELSFIQAGGTQLGDDFSFNLTEDKIKSIFKPCLISRVDDNIQKLQQHLKGQFQAQGSAEESKFLQQFHQNYSLFKAMYQAFEYYRFNTIVNQKIVSILSQVEENYFSSIQSIYNQCFENDITLYKSQQLQYLSNRSFKECYQKLTTILQDGNGLDVQYVQQIISSQSDFIHDEFESMLKQQYEQLTSYQLAFTNSIDQSIKQLDVKMYKQISLPDGDVMQKDSRYTYIINVKSMSYISKLNQLLDFLEIGSDMSEVVQLTLRIRRQAQNQAHNAVQADEYQYVQKLTQIKQTIHQILMYEKKLQIYFYLAKYKQYTFCDGQQMLPVVPDKRVVMLGQLLKIFDDGRDSTQRQTAQYICDTARKLFLSDESTYNQRSVANLLLNLQVLLSGDSGNGFVIDLVNDIKGRLQ